MTVTSCFVYKFIRDLNSIDHLCINPILWIGLIHKLSIDSRLVKWGVQVNILLNNCKQNITSLSLLVGATLGECLLISSLHVPGKSFRTLVDIARLAEQFIMRPQSQAW